MNELHEQIQNAIIADDRPHGTRPVLLQVLELHAQDALMKMGSTYWGTRMLYHCQECGGRDWDIDGFIGACPTVRVIAEAYGVEVEAIPPRGPAEEAA